jgi:hypothetical protein
LILRQCFSVDLINLLFTDAFTALFGRCCCYCKSGSPVTVYTSMHPLGPWSKQNQIGFSSFCSQDLTTSRNSAMLFGSSSPSLTHCNSTDFFSMSVGAQQSDVFPWKDSEGLIQHMYVNQYESCASALTRLVSCITAIAGSHPLMGLSHTTSHTFTL